MYHICSLLIHLLSLLLTPCSSIHDGQRSVSTIRSRIITTESMTSRLSPPVQISNGATERLWDWTTASVSPSSRPPLMYPSSSPLKLFPCPRHYHRSPTASKREAQPSSSHQPTHICSVLETEEHYPNVPSRLWTFYISDHPGGWVE